MEKVIDYDRNTSVDCALLKKNGIRYHILKVLYGATKRTVEPAFLAHAKKCADNGIYFDVYNYTYAGSEAEAKSDMSLIINAIQSLPVDVRRYFNGRVWFDIEDKKQAKFSKSKNQGIIKAAKEVIETAGFEFGVYTGMSYYNEHIGSTCGVTKWWIARYYLGDTRMAPGKDPNAKYKPSNIPAKYLFAWQYTSSMYLKGAATGDGENLDCSVIYGEFLRDPQRKTVDQLAKEVIAGLWGNGEDRKKRLGLAGYDYQTVQKRVNELVK